MTGPKFLKLHLLFEEHCTKLAVDEIAERIRTLSVNALGTYRAFAELSSIVEIDGTSEAGEMVKILTKGHEQLVRTCRTVLKTTQAADDESSTALISDRMRIHEKTAWILGSLQ